MLFDLEIKLRVDYNPDTESLAIKEFDLIHQSKISNESVPYKKTHELTDSQERYGILTLGASMPIPTGSTIHFIAKKDKIEKKYCAKSHRTVKGRIDGLRQFFKDFESVLQINSSYEVEYIAQTNTVIFHI